MALTERDFIEAAAELGCDVPAIRAIDEVESSGSGFRADGKPKILFEPHVFSKLTDGKFDVSHPGLSYPKWDGRKSATYKRDQHEVLKEAGKLDPEAAMAACSWGRYQIMGENWFMTGARRFMDFIADMYESEAKHLQAFVGFCKKKAGLQRALREHDWANVARLYNGPGSVPVYQKKLAEAFAKHGGKK